MKYLQRFSCYIEPQGKSLVHSHFGSDLIVLIKVCSYFLGISDEFRQFAKIGYSFWARYILFTIYSLYKVFIERCTPYSYMFMVAGPRAQALLVRTKKSREWYAVGCLVLVCRRWPLPSCWLTLTASRGSCRRTTSATRIKDPPLMVRATCAVPLLTQMTPAAPAGSVNIAGGRSTTWLVSATRWPVSIDHFNGGLFRPLEEQKYRKFPGQSQSQRSMLLCDWPRHSNCLCFCSSRDRNSPPLKRSVDSKVRQQPAHLNYSVLICEY